MDDEDLYTSDEMDEYDKDYEDLQREEAFKGHAQPGEVNVSEKLYDLSFYICQTKDH